MSVCRIMRSTTITVPDHKNLVDTYRSLKKRNADFLIGAFVVENPLTPSQFKRLPAELKRLIKSGEAVTELERLCRLEDPR